MGSYDSPGYADKTPAGRVDESTGLGAGSEGIGTDPVNLESLGRVIVTVPGSSSVPDQPMATVDTGDSSVPSQVQQFVAGHQDLLTGDGAYLGKTGLGTGHVLGGG